MTIMGMDFSSFNLMEVSWVIWLGIALVIWLAYDLINGSVYLHREIDRNSEPSLYWFSIVLWGAVAASCFVYE